MKVPDLDVIVFADGRVRVMDWVGPSTWICVLEASAWKPTWWLDLDTTNARDGELSAGEASAHGSIGWIARSGVWTAASRRSNPFVAVRREGDEVVAENNNGVVWRLDRDDPTEARITSP